MAQNSLIYTLFGKTGAKSRKIAINLFHSLAEKIEQELNQLLPPNSYLMLLRQTRLLNLFLVSYLELI